MKHEYQNRPSPFPGRMSWDATKPAFSFSCSFCVVVHLFWLVNACFFVLGFVFLYQASQLPFVPNLCILSEQTKTCHIVLNTAPQWLSNDFVHVLVVFAVTVESQPLYACNVLPNTKKLMFRITNDILHCFIKKIGPFVISSYLCFGSYELQKISRST